MFPIVWLCLLILRIISECTASTPSRRGSKEAHQALTGGVRSLSFDSDDDDDDESIAKEPVRFRGPFSDDDEDEGRGASSSSSSSGPSSGASARSPRYQLPPRFQLGDIDSADDSGLDGGLTSGV